MKPDHSVVLLVIFVIIWHFYLIIYEWIHLLIENQGAKLGTGLGLLSAMFITIIFKFSPRERMVYFISIVVAAGLIGGAVFEWNEDFRSTRTNPQQFVLKMFQTLAALVWRLCI